MAIAVSGINVFVHLTGIRIRCVDCEFHGVIDFFLDLALNLCEGGAVGNALGAGPGLGRPGKDGGFRNAGDKTFGEADPALATAFALLALSYTSKK